MLINHHSLKDFGLILSQGALLYTDMIWRLSTKSTPDGGIVAIASIILYTLFALRHKSYSTDVIRMGQTAFYLVEWVTAMHSLQYWYVSERHDTSYIVGYGAFMGFSLFAALIIHHDIQAHKELSHATASPRITYTDPQPQGNIQSTSTPVAPFRPFAQSSRVSAEPYQQIV